MDISQLIDNLEKQRTEFGWIISKINNGDTYAVELSDETIFTPHHIKFFLFNAQAMTGMKRFSGKPQYVHQASTAYLVSQMPGITAEDRETAIGYALGHDFVEDAANYDPNIVDAAIDKLGFGYQDDLTAAVILSSPLQGEFNRILEKTAGVLLVKRHGNRAHAIASITDKLDNLLDLEYMKVKQYDDDTRHRKIARFFASYTLYALEELSSMLPKEFADYAKMIVNHVVEKEGVPVRLVQDELKNFKSTALKYQQQIISECATHLKKFGVAII